MCLENKPENINMRSKKRTSKTKSVFAENNDNFGADIHDTARGPITIACCPQEPKESTMLGPVRQTIETTRDRTLGQEPQSCDKQY